MTNETNDHNETNSDCTNCGVASSPSTIGGPGFLVLSDLAVPLYRVKYVEKTPSGCAVIIDDVVGTVARSKDDFSEVARKLR